VLFLGWRQYVQNGRDLSLPAQNILPGGSFDTFGAHGVPSSWMLAKSGLLDYRTSSDKGYVSGKLFSLSVDHYTSGNLDLTSPKVNVEPNKTYLYKGYYQTTGAFDLLVRYYYANDTSQLRYVQTYPNSGDAWSTDSSAFRTGNNIRAVQFVYRLASNGTLKLDETYLEKKSTGVYVPSTLRDTNIWVPNASLSRSSGTVPDQWSPYRTGNNRASFTYNHKPDEPAYVSTRITRYKSGEAKWQYSPQPVSTSQAFTFGITYRSSARSSIVAEYVLQNGRHQFETLATLTPAGEWTRYQTQFEAPKGATTMFVSVVLKAKGALDTTAYALRDSTRPGPREFHRALVSITFDDGWRSVNQNALPIMSAYGYKGTFYLNPSALDTTNFIGQKQVDELLAKGEQIGSHGFSHADMTSINADQLDAQLSRARAGYNTRGTVHPLDFATPYGKSDAEVQYAARKHYRSLRSTDSGLNTRQNFDTYDIKVLYVATNTPDSEIKQALTEATALHGWLVLVYHRVQTANVKLAGAGENTVVTPQRFNDHLQFIKQSNIAVKTVAGALDELTPQL
jgi:peptidoglycan/xylan/chitin deacetylase (PgdA/CDA1 family)